MGNTSTKIFKKFLFILIPVALILTIVAAMMEKETYNKHNLSMQIAGLEGVASASAALILENDVSLIVNRKDFDSSTWYAKVYKQVLDIQKKSTFSGMKISLVKKGSSLNTLIMTNENRNRIGDDYDVSPELTQALQSGKVTNKQILKAEGQLSEIIVYAPLNGSKNIALVLSVVPKIEEKELLSFVGNAVLFTGALLLVSILVLMLEMNKLKGGVEEVELNLTKLKKSENLVLYAQTDAYLSELYTALKALETSLKDTKNVEDEKSKVQKQIKDLLKIVSSSADGDFTQKAEVTADALGALADSFNIMISDLSDLIRDVKNAADQVAVSTQEIATNNNSMYEGAVLQASQTENISELARGLADLIFNTNQNAQRASKAAKTAKEVAVQGGETIEKSTLGMHKIRTSVREVARQMKYLSENSERISEITDFISDIANRTNLLALNASIEAARAGEAGRGFTVVAEEIRNLSERSSKSANEISQLIEDIQTGTAETVKAIEKGETEVSAGSRLVEGAGDTLKEIITSVEISTQSTVEISDATEEQTKISSDIVGSLERIAGIAKETSESANQSKESGTTLAYLSENLNKTVEKFRLSE